MIPGVVQYDTVSYCDTGTIPYTVLYDMIPGTVFILLYDTGYHTFSMEVPARHQYIAHVCSNYRQSGLNRGSEKAYYENARQAHYERFGPRLVASCILQVGPPTTLLLASRSGAGGWFPAS